MHQKTQNHFINIFYTFVCKKVPGKLQTNIWKISTQLLEKFKLRYASKIFYDNSLLSSFSLQLISFFRTAVLRKLFDIGFSYKHFNFSHVCLLVKMASKTVTRSIPAEVNSKGGKYPFGQPACKIRYYNLSITQVRYIKSLASESKPFQSRSTVEIPGPARREEQLSRSKLKQAFLIDSDAELFMYLIQCIRFGS